MPFLQRYAGMASLRQCPAAGFHKTVDPEPYAAPIPENGELRRRDHGHKRTVDGRPGAGSEPPTKSLETSAPGAGLPQSARSSALRKVQPGVTSGLTLAQCGASVAP